MIKSILGQCQINIDLQNIQFYKDLMNFMGWKVVYEDHNILGVEDEHGTSLWFASPEKKIFNDYDGTGMNHLGFLVPRQADVDNAVAYIQKLGIPLLFETPRHRPEFCINENVTYYQVMFESPDRLLLEVVYTGPKSQG